MSAGVTKPSYAQAAWHFGVILGDGTIQHVADTLGGLVKVNFEIPVDQGGFANACAVRMSYVLNQCSVTITSADGATVTDKNDARYLYRVNDLRSFLTRKFGRPNLTLSSPTPAALVAAGKKGIVVFSVSGWSDASGHATLWNGAGDCSDRCYWFPQASSAQLWELP